MQLLRLLLLVSLGCVIATQELFEWKKYHNYRRRLGARRSTTERSEHQAMHHQHTQSEHLTDIPNSFEIRGDSAKKDFQKYIDDIQDLAQKQNVKVTYKVKVDMGQNPEQNLKRASTKPKSKKHNGKRNNNGKLSAREMALNQLGEFPEPIVRSSLTLQSRKASMMTTKEPLIVNYKPLYTQVKLNFKKRVKPVKTSVITLQNKDGMK